MKKINGYWVDKDNNKWNCNAFSKEEAKKHSKTLIDCTDCTDCRNCIGCRNCSYCIHCRDCRDCSDCIYCSHCIDCSYCSNCRNCTDCSYCRNCMHCSYCSNCRNCTDCSNCRNCMHCSYCSNCSDFESNPERYVSYSLGSRVSNTTFYFYENKINVVCGCFVGDMQEFISKINETYKTDNKHYKDYMKLIEKVKTIFGRDE